MGRPKGFERDAVLDLAIEVFRRKGYDGTSMQQLIDAMGINRFSLYSTFGDKHQLFLAAFDRYEARRRNQLCSLLEQPGPRIPQIRKYLEEVIHEGLSQERLGCMLVNSAVELALRDKVVAERCEGNFRLFEDLFYEALAEAEEAGEIQKGLNLRALSRFLISSTRGLRVVSRVVPNEDVLQDIVNVTLSTLLPA